MTVKKYVMEILAFNPWSKNLQEPFNTEPFGTKEVIEPERKERKGKRETKSIRITAALPYPFTIDKVAVSSIE